MRSKLVFYKVAGFSLSWLQTFVKLEYNLCSKELMKTIRPLIIFYKSKIALTITLLSLLSLIPLAFFYKYANEINELQQVTKLTPGQAERVLSRTLTLPELYIPFTFGILFWVSNAIITSFALARGYIRPTYAIPTLALGGLGFHLVIAILLVLPWNKIIEKFKWMAKWLNITNLLAIVGIGGIAIVLPFSNAMSKTSFETPYIAPAVKFSLDKNHPNLVEVFTDGFDLSHYDSSDYEKDSNFKEFTWFKHFATAGHPTHLSLSMIFDDFKESNPFATQYEKNVPSDQYLDYQYGEGMLKTGVAHMNLNKNEFSSRTLINPVGFSDSPYYGASVSSTPEAILKEDPTLNVTNWVGARDSNGGYFGIENYPPDIQGYRWLEKNSKAASVGEKGARVYISDMITHRPFVVDDKQNFALWDIKREDTAKTLHSALTDIINALKNIKDNSGFNAYDNSLFMVYGDHASHDFMTYYETGENSSRTTESSFIVKFPKQSSDTSSQKSMNVVDDKFVWAPQINGIINDYFSASSAQKNDSKWFNNYFYHNSQSSKFNNVPRPIFRSTTAYEWSSWKLDNNEWKFTTDISNPNYKVEWSKDRLSQQAQVAELRKVDY